MIKREKKISPSSNKHFFLFLPLLPTLFPLAFTPAFFLFLPPTPNPLLNALKPTHCAGWVAFLTRIIQKQKTHGTQSMGFLIPTTTIAPTEPCLNHSEGGFACFRFISTNFNKYIFEGRGARYRIDIFRNQHICLGKIHQRISLSDIKRPNF